MGNVKMPGAFSMEDTESTVLKILALSQGLMPYAGKEAYIYRSAEMNIFRIAQLNELGVPIVIVLLPDSFGQKPLSEKRSLGMQLQACATSTGLPGTVCLVWDAGSGRLGYIAPPGCRAFLDTLDVYWVGAHLNGQLSCSARTH